MTPLTRNTNAWVDRYWIPHLLTAHPFGSHTGTSRTPPRSPIRRVLSGLPLAFAFGLLALSGYQVGTGQWHATPVLSGSMRPGLQPGDVVVTHRVPISDLHVRDVVVFHPPNEGSRLTVHRIVKLTVKGGTTSITTWGDANAAADAAVSSLSGTTAYRVERVVPLVGYPAIWLQSGGRGMLAIALGLILLIAAAVTILRPDKPSKSSPAEPTGPPGSADPTDRTSDAVDKSDDLLESGGDRL